MAAFDDAISDLDQANQQGQQSQQQPTPAQSGLQPFDQALRDLSGSFPGGAKGPGIDVPPSGEPQESKMLGYEGARGLTFNLIDKLAPQGLQSQARQFEAESPYKAGAAQIVGSLVPGAIAPEVLPLSGFRAGATMAEAAGANALLGGLSGAASGYGESQDHPVRDALYGASLGASTGGLLGSLTGRVLPAVKNIVAGS